MTISSTVRRAGPFVGNGTSTVFPFSFKIFDKTNVKVLLTAVSGALSTLVLDSDYSVTLNADQNNNPGGTITYPLAGSPMISGFSLLVLGNLAISQPTDITNSGGFYPNVIEDMVDRATIQIQQLATDQSLSLSFPENEAISGLLPAVGTRANMLLAFDGSGNPTVQPITASIGAGVMTAEGPFQAGINFIPGTTTTLQLSQAYGATANVQVHFDGVYQGPDQYTLLGAQLIFNSPIPVGTSTVYVVGGTSLSIYLPSDGETVPAGTKMYNRINDMVSARDYGARADGVTPAIDVAAINAAANSGASSVLIPDGLYVIDGPLNIPPNVTLYSQTANRSAMANVTKGAWFYVTYTGGPAVILNSGSAIRGIGFYYPNQLTVIVTAPIAYPASIRFAGSCYNAEVDNCYFANSYIGVDTAPATGNATLTVKNCRGYPLSIGISLDNGFDVNWVNFNMFSPNYYPGFNPDATLKNWVQNNGVGVQIQRSDDGIAIGNFMFGYKYAYFNLNSFSGFKWTDCSADGCLFPVNIFGTSGFISFKGGALNAISNASGGTTPGLIAISISCSGPVVVDGSTIGYSSLDGVSIQNNPEHVLLKGLNINQVAAYGASIGAPGAGIRISGAPSVVVDGGVIDLASGPAIGVLAATVSGTLSVSGALIKRSQSGLAAITIDAGTVNYSITNNTFAATGGLSDGGGAVNKVIANNMTV